MTRSWPWQASASVVSSTRRSIKRDATRHEEAVVPTVAVAGIDRRGHGNWLSPSQQSKAVVKNRTDFKSCRIRRAPMPYVTVGKESCSSIESYYKDSGNAQPVVFSHGWPLSAEAFHDQMLYVASRGYAW